MSPEVYIFDVGAGQCIFIRHYDKQCTLVDCAYNENAMQSIKKLSTLRSGFPSISQLIITNVDEDHISGINWLQDNQVGIVSIFLPENLDFDKIKGLKEKKTAAFKTLKTLSKSQLCHYPIDSPCKIYRFALKEEQLPEELWSTNNFSQVIFVDYNGVIICIPGDIEEEAWDLLIKYNEEMIPLLNKTKIFVASHHGRDSGYNLEALSHCNILECIIVSDKSIQYETQEGMVSKYEQHVHNDGVFFDGRRRKVLTTRDDGDIHIMIDVDGYGKTHYYPHPYKSPSRR